MATQLDELKVELKRIARELDVVRAKIRQLEQQQRDETPPFAKLRGVWNGANFTDEEIEAAKIRVKDFPE